MPHTRRHFLRSTAATACAAVAPRLYAGSPTTPAIGRFTPLAYNEVELLAGPMLDQFQHNHALFLGLDDDRLLKPFRQLAGQPAPGEDMGGWYSPSPDFDPPRNMTGYIPGHSFGQYMSGLARAYAVTGDPATKRKVDGLVTGFAGTVSPKFYEHYCLPSYTFEKTLQGLSDARQFCGSPHAQPTLDAALDAALPWLPDHALTRAEMDARPHPNMAYAWDESYTLPENLYLAYTRGAGPRYRTLAQRFLQDRTYFLPLSQGENVLPGQHAYSHLNALNSALQAYLVDGSAMHLRAAQNGFRFVQEQSYATGGWGPDETFQNPAKDGLADKVEHGHGSFETPCGAYGHFKIARGLLCVTGDPGYGDSMETVLLNTILGARPIQPDGTSFYYANYSPNSAKQWYGLKWPCCSGTFPQLTADYGISTYLRTANGRGLAVNLYHPSRARVRVGGASVQLTQTTSYPANGDITLSLSTDRHVRFPLQLRIPAWAGAATRVSVNGRAADANLLPGTWLTLDRTWRSGDRVELTLDLPLRLVPLDAHHPNLVALVSGPLALFALEPAAQQVTGSQLLAAKREGNGPAWTVATATQPLRLLPYTAIGEERYRLYLQT